MDFLISFIFMVVLICMIIGVVLLYGTYFGVDRQYYGVFGHVTEFVKIFFKNRNWFWYILSFPIVLAFIPAIVLFILLAYITIAVILIWNLGCKK